MLHQGFKPLVSQAFAVVASLGCVAASAAPIFWTDWMGSDTDPGPGFIGQGTITTPTSTVNVTYTKAVPR